MSKFKDYGMTPKCRRIAAAMANLRTSNERSNINLLLEGLGVLFAVQWCKENECEFAARTRGLFSKRLLFEGAPGRRRWQYLVERANYTYSVESSTPLGAVRKMQQWMSERSIAVRKMNDEQKRTTTPTSS